MGRSALRAVLVLVLNALILLPLAAQSGQATLECLGRF